MRARIAPSWNLRSPFHLSRCLLPWLTPGPNRGGLVSIRGRTLGAGWQSQRRPWLQSWRCGGEVVGKEVAGFGVGVFDAAAMTVR